MPAKGWKKPNGKRGRPLYVRLSETERMRAETLAFSERLSSQDYVRLLLHRAWELRSLVRSTTVVPPRSAPEHGATNQPGDEKPVTDAAPGPQKIPG